MKRNQSRTDVSPVSRNRLLALEQRMLFDGAAAVIADTAIVPRSGAEDAHVAISGISVSDDTATQHITLNASHGTLTLASTSGLTGLTGNGGANISFSGSLADINAALNGMSFTGDQNFNGAASFTLNSDDGTSITSKTIAINVTPVNDTPVISGSGPALQVDEGGSASFSAATNSADGKGFNQSNLGLSDVDNVQQQVIVKLTSLAGDGTLLLNGKELGIGSSFSVDQLANLSYRHNGDQVTNPAGLMDNFTITIDDGAGGVLHDQVVQVHINPVDQAPTSSGTITVIEGEQNVSLTDNGNLITPIGTPRGSVQISDPDQAPGVDYSYSLDTLPTRGTLFYNGVEITSTAFVITDLSKLTYSHNGTEPSATGTTDSFNLKVTDDGGGTGTPKTSTLAVNLTILPNNDDPVLDHSITQNLAPGEMTRVVTSGMLQVTDSDSFSSSLSYTLTAVPDRNIGYFTLNGGLLVAGSKFTQADVNAGNVVYHVRAYTGTARTDSISFTVKDGGVRLYPSSRDGGIYDTEDASSALTVNTFSVNVPPETATLPGAIPADPPANTMPIVGGDKTATLDEAGTYTLTAADLSASDDFTAADGLTYRVLVTPGSGTLRVNGVAIGAFGTFTQDDVDNGRVTFQHSGNERFVDSFQFSVSDGTLTTATESFSLSIVPKNDTPTAVTGGRVFTAEGGTVTITGSNIVVADSDRQGDASGGTQYATTNDVVLQITALPQFGTLTLNGVSVTLNQTISAAQLAAGDLKYVHDGSEHFTDSFTVVPVDDQGVAVGAGTNQSSTGVALVVPVTISPVNDAPELSSKSQLIDGEAGAIREGQSAVIGGASGYANADGSGSVNGPVAGAHLVYRDDDNSSVQRQYRLTAIPQNGKLLLDGGVLGLGSVFTQADLDAGRVTYQHDGSETSTDAFSYIVSDGDFSANDSGSFAQGNAATASTYNIEILPTNDKPTVTSPSSPVNIDSTTASNNQVGGFVVGDPDVLGGSSDTPDAVQVIVRLTQADGTAFTAGEYAGVTLSVGLAGGATRDGDKDGNGDYLVLRGTRAQVNAALATLTASVNDPSNEDHQYRIQVVVDDRLRDAGGSLTSGANGGSLNQAAAPGGAGQPISAVEFNGYADSVANTDLNLAQGSVLIRVSTVNDAPGVTIPASQLINEDRQTAITGITVVDTESTALDVPVSVTVSVPSGQGVLGIAGAGAQTSITVSGRTVTISGDNSNSVTLVGRADDIQSLLNDASNGLKYTGATNANHDYNGGAAGDVTLSVQINEGAAAIGGDTGSGSVAPVSQTAVLAITLQATNDAPTVAAGSGNLAVGQGGVAVAVPGFSVSDPDYSDGGGITAPAGEATSPEQDFIQVTVRLTNAGGVPLNQAAYADILLGSTSSPTEDHTTFEVDDTHTGTGSALVIRGTRANVNAYLAGLQVTLSGSLANTDTSYKVQVIADDRMRDVTTGTLDPAGLANGGLNPSGATVVSAPTTVIDPYAALPGSLPLNMASNTRTLFVSSINDPTVITASDVTVREGSATLNLTGSVGGFSASDPDANGASTFSATVHVSQGVISAVGGSGGTLGGLGSDTITLTGATEAQVNARLQALTITYPTGAGAPAGADYTGNFTVTVTVNDGGSIGQRPGVLSGDTNDASQNPGDYGYADGTSAELITTRTINVTVTPVNDAPGASGLSAAQTVTKGGNPVRLDSDGNVTVADPELDVSPDKWMGATLTIGRQGGSNANDVFGLFDSNVNDDAVGVQINGSDLIVDGVTVGTLSNASGTLQVTFNADADSSVVGKVMGAVTYRNTDPSASASADVHVDFVLDDQNPNTTDSGTAGSGQDQGAEGQKAVTRSTTIHLNTVPVAVDDGLQTVQQGDPANGNVLPNDSDPDGNTLSVSGFTVAGVSGSFNPGDTATLSGVGTLTLNADGSYVFTPTSTYHGDVPVVTYSISDGVGGSDSADLTIRVNAPPVAVDDGLQTVQQGDPASGNVLPNDSDPDGNALSVSGFTVAGVSGSFNPGDTATITGVGTLTLNADGSYLFTPTSTYHGDVPVVTYGISDGVGGSDSADLTLRVNAPPVAVDDGLQTVQQGNPASGNVLPNDTDPDGNTLSVSGFTVAGVSGSFNPGDTATISGVGTLRINADGSYLFTPTSGYHGDVPVVTYSISDGTGGSDSADLTLRVNARPVAVDDGLQTVQQGNTASGNVLPNDSDPEGNALSVSGFTVVGVAGSFNPGDTATISGVGTLILNADGSYVFTPTSTYHGDVPVVTYTLSDGVGGSDNADLTLRVNAPPVAVDDGLQTVQQGNPASGNVLPNDTDPDGNTLNVSGFTVAGVSGSFNPGDTATISGVGTLTLNADGSYVFTPTSAYHGDVPVVTYGISDGVGGSDSADLTIRVNAPPVAVDDGLQTVQQGDPASGNVLPNDSDPDGNALSVSGFTVAGVSGSFNPGDTATISGVGTLRINADGSYLFTPAPTYHGDVPVITYSIRDGVGGSDSADLTLRVNAPPVAVDDGLQTVQQGNPASGNVLPNDTDPDGNTLSVSGFTVAGVSGSFNPGDTATISGVGTLTLNADGSYLFTPAPTYHGNVPVVTYTISDGTGGTDSADLTLRVNAPPVAVDDGLQTVQQGNPASGNVLPNDTDPDGNTLSVSGFTVAGVSGSFTPGDTAIISGVGTLQINADGSYLFTPTSAYHGDVPVVTYTISDGTGGSDSADLTLRVNARPTATDDGVLLTDRDTPIQSITVLGNDSHPDGYTLTVTQAQSPNGSVTINPDGTLDFTPAPGVTGDVVITYQISDGHGGSDTAQVRIHINEPPVAVNDGVHSGLQGDPLNGSVLGNDSDPENDAIHVVDFTIAGVAGTHAAGSSVVIAGVGTLTLARDGSYQFVPVDTYVGTVPTINYRITDDHGGFATAQLALRIDSSVLPLPPASQAASDLHVPSGDVERHVYPDWHLDLLSVQRSMVPGLFVTLPVMDSQAQAAERLDPLSSGYNRAVSGQIQSESIGIGLGFVPDLHVTQAVQESQKTVDYQERSLKFKDSEYFTGGDSLFDDFSALVPPANEAPVADVEQHQPSRVPKAAASFSDQVNKAAAGRQPHLYSDGNRSPAPQRKG
ncbi:MULTISPECIES: Ig-like domain-containing protein [Pseudomonas]|uniref:Ig-like domain-containing protein n=1 Tax=Pseudomonas TaxID=286 RepID=UPI001BE809A8|nr:MULTISPECIES: Ig-like domain-containing protein [Pseudomonas]MBT2339800.1 cadherin-like domain-containing protein [Pseudomonas fluorescens]MCD4529549.1 Ig-like domain-containing protein [Pseudomonas sp. C3-2018]